jgi:Ca2+/Na+ antiporter
MAIELAIIALVVLLAFVIARRRTSETRSVLEILLAFRTMILGAFILVFALVLIFTGIWLLVLLGALLLFLIVLFVVTVREDGDLRSATEVIRSWL